MPHSIVGATAIVLGFVPVGWLNSIAIGITAMVGLILGFLPIVCLVWLCDRKDFHFVIMGLTFLIGFLPIAACLYWLVSFPTTYKARINRERRLLAKIQPLLDKH